MNIPSEDIIIHYNPSLNKLAFSNKPRPVGNLEHEALIGNLCQDLNKLYKESKSCFGKSKAAKIKADDVNRICKRYTVELDKNYTVANESPPASSLNFTEIKVRVSPMERQKYVSGIFNPSDLARIKKPGQ